MKKFYIKTEEMNGVELVFSESERTATALFKKRHQTPISALYSEEEWENLQTDYSKKPLRAYAENGSIVITTHSITLHPQGDFDKEEVTRKVLLALKQRRNWDVTIEASVLQTASLKLITSIVSYEESGKVSFKNVKKEITEAVALTGLECEVYYRLGTAAQMRAVPNKKYMER
jgi:hypothetical protein